MDILLLKPKALYVLTRFADACSRQGINLHILLAAKTPVKHYVVSFIQDAFDTVVEIPVAIEDAHAIAPFLEKYDAIIPSGEYSVIFGEQLSQQTGVFHNDLDKISAYRDKYLMRQCFAAAGVNQPKLLAKFATMEEVDIFDWESINFPVIVKPIDLSSSFYVRLCHDVDNAKKIYRRIFKHSQSFSGVTFSAQGLLEEVAFGPEYSVECVVENRRIVALFLTSKFLSSYPSCDEIGHLSGEQFADVNLEKNVKEAVQGIIRAWNITSAVMHVEFKICGDEIKVIEGACRIGGDMISSIVEMRYGVSLEECLILLRCNRDVAGAFKRYSVAGDGYYYGVNYLFHENLRTPVPLEIEIIQVSSLAKQDAGAGGGFGVESRLGHRIIRSRSLEAMKSF